jgi:chemotaxis signal transduction protein
MLSPVAAPRPGTLLRCQEGGATFCLELDQVARIERSDRLLPGPGGEEPLGYLPAAGALLPVWRLAQRLGLPVPSRRGVHPVLVVKSLGRLWGLVVERAGRAAGREAATVGPAVSPLPPLAGDPRRGWFSGVVQLAEGLALMLDPERLHPDAAPAAETPAAEGVGEPRLQPRPPLAGPGQLAARRRRLVLFSTSPGGGSPLRFALSLSQVLEIARPQALVRVPGSDDSFLGLARWREEALPVVDLQLRLGAGPSFFEGASRLLVARCSRQAQAVGFPVRPEIRLLPLPPESRPATPPGADDSLLRGAFVADAGTILVPDLDRLLSRR